MHTFVFPPLFKKIPISVTHWVFQLFFQANYKKKYDDEVKGHYIGSYEDVYMLHCQKVEEMKSEV